jgi:hypothetical protein
MYVLLISENEKNPLLYIRVNNFYSQLIVRNVHMYILFLHARNAIDFCSYLFSQMPTCASAHGFVTGRPDKSNIHQKSDLGFFQSANKKTLGRFFSRKTLCYYIWQSMGEFLPGSCIVPRSNFKIICRIIVMKIIHKFKTHGWNGHCRYVRFKGVWYLIFHLCM